ncbi:bark storage protein B [Jatropha curcas]|uniref:bark storage protein B n=1 Tax=Jatropha curcas TaxID=180498 RepID=UPI00189333C5|nr:bark storage protein B [Jatropha curcas]
MALAGPPHKMWAFRISVVVFGLLAMAQQSTPLSLRNPVYEMTHKFNGLETYPVGVVSLTSDAENALIDSGVFTVTSSQKIAGKLFYIGKINGTDVVYARAGELMVNVGSTVQVMVDIFNVRGIVN